MVTHAATRPVIVRDARLTGDRLGGLSALSLAATGLVYSLSFVLIRNDALTAATLALGGLLTTALYSALYERLRGHGAAVARWGSVLGLIGAGGALIHGGYDLANALHPPASRNVDLPSAIDPRGLLTFGIAGLAVALVAALLARDATLPRALPWLGYLTAALMLVLYAGRLIILDATHPLIVVVALLVGFLVGPAWNLWLGALLLRGRRD